ncbi:hypothetical protein CMI48_02420 [Candidatus Pacearchaeota archaeon]|jgi:hypothetical protein|nr:hypothetical protein [Candidatus Pacearchaeota archaeon]|tara:strand:- start:1366 stop:1683 length:318 start_codon:yes stop_codon:yes gene_type:complete
MALSQPHSEEEGGQRQVLYDGNVIPVGEIPDLPGHHYRIRSGRGGFTRLDHGWIVSALDTCDPDEEHRAVVESYVPDLRSEPAFPTALLFPSSSPLASFQGGYTL